MRCCSWARCLKWPWRIPLRVRLESTPRCIFIAWAGFAVRYTYWAAQCIAIGGEAVAIAIYCQWWFPNTPKWLWILGFSIALFMSMPAASAISAASNIGSP